MKKNFLFAALASVVLVGCTSDDSVEQALETRKIKFDNPVMNISATKAPGFFGEITGSTYPEAESFMVYSRVYKGTFNGWNNSTGIINFWDNAQEASKSATAYWETSGSHYWPNDPYKLVFASYSPSSILTDGDATSISYDETGIKITGFKTQDVSDKQYDLMYSSRNTDCDKSNCLDGVPVKFNHALSSIVFGAMENVAGKEYKIKELKLIGDFITQGDFAEKITETFATGSTVYSEVSNPAWSNFGTASTKTYTPSFDEVIVTSEANLFTSGKSAILPIPQNSPAGAYILLTYEVKQDGSILEYEDKKIYLSDFKDGSGNPITKWEIGKRYLYIINFGGTSKIYFKPTVTDWVEGGMVQVKI